MLNTLIKYNKDKGVKIHKNAQVKNINVSGNKVTEVVLSNGKIFQCDSVILATGGVSYPGTGSTGEGHIIAKNLGHTVTDLKPSLVPLITKEKWVKSAQGLSLKNVSITLFNKQDSKIYSDFGEMLFTHFGVSGPLILSCSRHILEYNYKGIKLVIDLKPALSIEKLDERIQRDFEKYSRKQFKNSLGDLLPNKLIPVIIELSGIDPEKHVNQIKKEERMKLVYLLKNLELEIIGSRPIAEAIVTAGGISINEINPRTMESKIIKGLFFAGEIIDVDAYTGGFNLTIAFSTGYLAGDSC